MRVTLVGRGMLMNAGTLERHGLGGSETAQLCVGRALSKMGHRVTQYCELNVPSMRDIYGTTWRHVDSLRQNHHECDLLIVCRRPDLIEQHWVKSAARVLWVQDFAAGAYPSRAELTHYDEVWYVSEWQRRQWERVLHQTPGTLPPNAWVTRNGVAPVMVTKVTETQETRAEKQLLFVSRPERGLVPLVRPGGIMDRLPDDYKLHVCGYADFPPQHREFYEQVWGWCAARTDTTMLGSLPQASVRELMRCSSALVLPTNYPETSCMSALEAVEQCCHVFHTPVALDSALRGSGAVKETLGSCGIMIHTGSEWNNDEFCQTWADKIVSFLENPEWRSMDRDRMLQRTDMWWPGIAREWTARAEKWLALGGL